MSLCRLPNDVSLSTRAAHARTSQRSTASDAIYARILAQNAVHGAMAGYTDCCAALANNRMVYIPLGLVLARSPRRMNARGRTMERVFGSTGQPDARQLDVSV